MPNKVRLDKYLERGPAFAFRGVADGGPFTVMLDSSAVMKLAGNRVGAEIRPAVEAAHGTVEAAVARLFAQGHAAMTDRLDRGDAAPRIMLSAIDLD